MHLTRTRLPGIVLAFVIASVGAALFVYLSAPLPIFLGALTASMIASIVGVPIKRPRSLSTPIRVVLGLAIGAAFTPALLDRIDELAISLALVVPFTAAITAAGYAFYRYVAGFDAPTSFFVSVPGGLTDMVFMAKDAGANERMVTLMQAVRMVLIVFAIPVWVAWTSDLPVGGAVLDTIHIWEIAPLDAAMLIVLGIVGWRVARWLGILGAAMIGPMMLSGAAHATGLTAAQVPSELLILAQLVLGILLGGQFRGLTMDEFTRWVSWALAFSVGLMIVAIWVATMVTQLTGADAVSVLLAYTPGGQSELNLLAIILQLDVAFIALHHIVRVAVSIVGAQLVFSASRDAWRRARDG
ncbi:MAG: AbrB family transcriptional regulator [Pseudomonadota bacterium]